VRLRRLLTYLLTSSSSSSTGSSSKLNSGSGSIVVCFRLGLGLSLSRRVSILHDAVLVVTLCSLHVLHYTEWGKR